MTNGDQGGRVVVEILRGLAELYDWPDFRPEVRSHRRLPAEELQAYEGSYRMESGSGPTVTLRAGDGVLLLEVPGQGNSTLHAVPDEADTFFDAADGQGVVFERGEDGAVRAVVAGGNARFVRVEG
jgi:hypothetical protein